MQATILALDRLLRAVGDPIGEIADIKPGHPEFQRARVLRAAAGVIAKSPDALPAIAQALHHAGRPSASPRFRAHLAAAAAWLAGHPIDAADRYAAILDRWPRDLLALRLAQSCYFFLGWHDRCCDMVDAIRPAWRREQAGYGFMLAMASFAHAERGDAAFAEALGREALALDHACPLGVHAVAHAIANTGRPASGAQWMREQRAHWATVSRMCTHNAWHLAMFDADAGNVASALHIFDTWLLPAGARSPLEACDATALLWRLASAGVDVAGRWQEVSAAFARGLTPGFWPFVDLHAGLAHLAAAALPEARRLARAIDTCATGTDYSALRVRQITQPGLRALDAWAAGRYGEAARGLADLQPLLVYAGGSRVQLEIFTSLRQDAGRRQGPEHDERSLASSVALHPEASLDLDRHRRIRGDARAPQGVQARPATVASPAPR